MKQVGLKTANCQRRLQRSSGRSCGQGGSGLKTAKGQRFLQHSRGLKGGRPGGLNSATGQRGDICECPTGFSGATCTDVRTWARLPHAREQASPPAVQQQQSCHAHNGYAIVMQPFVWAQRPTQWGQQWPSTAEAQSGT